MNLWQQSDWPDEKIEAYGDKLTAIIPLEWNWDPAYTQPRFRAFPKGWVLGIYVDGSWWLDDHHSPYEAAASGDNSVSFEAGARELLAVWREKGGGS